MEALSARLSQLLVAFTIEFDNLAEQRIQHWTTESGRRQGVWMTSMAMWWNCMRYVGSEPIGVKELQRRARTRTNLHGMQRWGYITVDPAPPKLIRATSKGLQAREIWEPLSAEIERHWEDRFGKSVVSDLREALYALVSQFELDLPDCLPILGYGLWSIGPDRKRTTPVERDLPLSTLLARFLLAFAMEFEQWGVLSLAICADVLRVLDEKIVRVRDLPALSGVSKEAIAMAMGILRKKNLVVVERAAVRLTLAGVEIREAYLRRLANQEARWKLDALRDVLEAFTGELLFQGIEPHPGNWRAAVRKPEVLPYFPMVLHRGGYPDGS